jgi:release factor glutamine methyltransferase
MVVAEALAQARQRGVARLDAQILLARHLGKTRTWLLAHDDHALPDPVAADYLLDLDRRAAGMPLAYLTGEREFHGLRFGITPAVLVPRPETEHLVDWALECLAARTAPRMADLGTGSGVIAITLARLRPDAAVTATDVDTEALRVAADNARDLEVRVELAAGDWWAAVPGRQFDLVTSNPPYIDPQDPHLATLNHEPRHALTPGGDGLDALRAIVAGAPRHLSLDGHLMLEHGYDQGAAVRALLAEAGFVDIQTRRDLAGLDRCSGARWPGAAHR